MNKVILIGRLTRDPEVRYTDRGEQMAVARYTLAVDRRRAQDGQQSADFISCVSFGKQAEFVEYYIHKGMKIVVEGRIQTGSYTNRDGQKVYTTDVIAESVEFAESKAASARRESPQAAPPRARTQESDGFMNIPDGVQEELPFS